MKNIHTKKHIINNEEIELFLLKPRLYKGKNIKFMIDMFILHEMDAFINLLNILVFLHIKCTQLTDYYNDLKYLFILFITCEIIQYIK